MRSTESFRSGAEAGSLNWRGIRDCIVCKSEEEPAADVEADPPPAPKEREELPAKISNTKQR
jgi:hypothetical protein